MIFPPRRKAPFEHFRVSDYNNLVDYIRRITPIAGENTKIDYSLAGARIKSLPKGMEVTAKILPWAIRYHVHSESQGYWEIYVPPAALSIGEPASVLPDKCKLSDVSTTDEYWYQLDVDEDKVEYINGKGYVDIIAHGKESAMKEGVDLLASGGKPYVGFESKYINADESEDDVKASKKIKAGDVVSFIVGRLVFTKEENEENGKDSNGNAGEDEATISRAIIQYASSPVTLKAAPKELFDLVWQYNVTDAAAKLTSVFLIRHESCIAGYNIIAESDDDMIDVTGYENIVAVIESTDDESTKYILTIKNEKQDSPIISTDNITKVKLFEMADDNVVLDARENLNRALVYR